MNDTTQIHRYFVSPKLHYIYHNTFLEAAVAWQPPPRQADEETCLRHNSSHNYRHTGSSEGFNLTFEKKVLEPSTRAHSKEREKIIFFFIQRYGATSGALPVAV